MSSPTELVFESNNNFCSRARMLLLRRMLIHEHEFWRTGCSHTRQIRWCKQCGQKAYINKNLCAKKTCVLWYGHTGKLTEAYED